MGVQQGVAELAALVDRAGRLRGDVAGDAAGEGEVPRQRAQPFLVAADGGVDLAVGVLKVGVGHQAESAVARAGHEECVQAAVDDHAGQAPTPWFRTACGLHQLRSRLLGLPVMAALASYFVGEQSGAVR